MRFIVATDEEGQDARLSHLPITAILYYHVNEDGKLAGLDHAAHEEVPNGLWEYLCLGCNDGFGYWADVERHLEEALV